MIDVVFIKLRDSPAILNRTILWWSPKTAVCWILMLVWVSNLYVLFINRLFLFVILLITRSTILCIGSFLASFGTSPVEIISLRIIILWTSFLLGRPWVFGMACAWLTIFALDHASSFMLIVKAVFISSSGFLLCRGRIGICCLGFINFLDMHVLTLIILFGQEFFLLSIILPWGFGSRSFNVSSEFLI